MKNLYLNPTTNDIEIFNYNLKITSGMDEFLSQKIENVLKTISGEFFANEFLGIPYFTEILGKPTDIFVVISIFRTAVIAIPEVSEIVEFNVVFNAVTRIFEIDYTVKAIDDLIVTDTAEV